MLSRHDAGLAPDALAASSGWRSSRSSCSRSSSCVVPVLNLTCPASSRAARAGLRGAAARQVHVLRDRGAWRWTWSGATPASCPSATALFFALGGYAMGMYLMRSIGREGVYRSDLPDFMVFLDWKELPWYWHGVRQLRRSRCVDGAARAGRRSRSCSASSPSARASRACTSRSSRRR